MLYWPQTQAGFNGLTFVLASVTEPESIVPTVRRVMAEFDPNLALANLQTMDEVLSASMKSQRAQTVLMGAFGAVALILAVIGIYGVTSQLVTTRLHEIGVRMTLGARPRQILRQLLSEGLWQAIAGLTIGLAAGVGLMRFGASLLYRVEPWDTATLATVSVVLLLAALAAFLLPARRAMRVDPAITLRST
jgi:ABC-type antimicrobial peptide transport system permease subunit